MEELIKQLMLKMNEKFEQMDTRFDNLEDDIKSLKGDVSHLKDDVNHLKGDVNHLKDDVNHLKGDINYLKEDVSIIKETVSNNLTKTRSHFKHLEAKFQEQNKMFQIVDGELNKVKIDVEYLSGKTGKHDAEINNLNKRLHS